jgi:DUF4097 and DUF4098 domain-containing protein YvlB
MSKMNASALSLALAIGSFSSGLSGCRVDHHGWDSNGHDSEAKNESGAINIAKMGGGIDVDDAPHGATLSTMGGGIHVGHAASFVKAKSMGGGIDIEHAVGPVDATTMGGGVSIDSADGPIKASTMGGDITARMVGTSTQPRDVELTSQGGTITLTVPKDFGMDLRVTLAYTKNAAKKYEIMAPSGLDQQETPDWSSSLGSPRKFIRAQGKIGDGLNHIVIKTVNGDVIVKQE